MSRSSNQKHKRKPRVAKGLPQSSGARAERRRVASMLEEWGSAQTLKPIAAQLDGLFAAIYPAPGPGEYRV